MSVSSVIEVVMISLVEMLVFSLNGNVQVKKKDVLIYKQIVKSCKKAETKS